MIYPIVAFQLMITIAKRSEQMRSQSKKPPNEKKKEFHFITKFVRNNVYNDCWTKYRFNDSNKKTFLPIEYISKNMNIAKKETCYEWNLHGNLIKCYCLASHSSVFGNRLIKCFYAHYCEADKSDLVTTTTATIIIIKEKQQRMQSMQSLSQSGRTICLWRLPLLFDIYHLHLRLHETLIGIDSNSFSWFLSSHWMRVFIVVSFLVLG